MSSSSYISIALVEFLPEYSIIDAPAAASDGRMSTSNTPVE
jgi:hypothetical protein